MIATHRVKDEDNQAIGFIVNDRFASDEAIRAILGEVGNLAVLENGTIRDGILEGIYDGRMQISI